MKTAVRLLGLIIIGALVWTCVPPIRPVGTVRCLASNGSSSQEDAETVLEALRRMNELIREGTKKYEAGEIGLIELWEQYMSKAMELKYQAMTDAFPDVFGYPFVQLYNHLEWIDKNLEVFQELAERAREDPDTAFDPASFSDVISELEREKGRLEGVVLRHIVDQKRAQAASAAQGKIGIALPAGLPLSCDDVDGTITLDELSRDHGLAAATELSPGALPVTAWAMRDDESVYLALEIVAPPSLLASQLLDAYVVFDVSRDGMHFTAGDDMKLLNLATGEAADLFYQDDYVFRRDVDFGGRHNVCAASSRSPLDSGEVLLEIEFLIPLDSGDRAGADPRLILEESVAIAFGLTGTAVELQSRDELVVTLED